MYINFKSKYKKIFWLLLGFMIACFFITSDVDALTQTDYKQLSLSTVRTLTQHAFNDSTLTNNLMTNYYKYCVLNTRSSDNELLYINCQFYPKNHYSYSSNHAYTVYNTETITGNYNFTFNYQTKQFNGAYKNTSIQATYFTWYNRNDKYPMTNPFTSSQKVVSSFADDTFYLNPNGDVFLDWTNTDNYDLGFGPYTVNFHLNGGSVWDLSNLLDPHLITEDYSIQTTTDELSEYLTHITPIKDYSNFIGWYYDSDFTLPYDSSNVLSSNIDLYAKFELYDYLQGYKRIDLTTDDRYYMLSDISSGSVFIPKRAFDDYGGRLSYYDNDLSSQPYTSYIQDYVTTPDEKFVRQDFNLSDYTGADWVMFSKYIYLEGEDDISYSIFVPDSSYDSSVVITPNSSGGNQFDFEYKDSNGDIQEGQVNSADLSQTSPLLGNVFDDFSSNTFGLTSIITAPLSLIQSLSSTSCTPLNLPLPFVGGTLTLPCMYDFYSNTFGVLFTLYQTITFGVVAYWVLVRIFNMVKDFKNPDHDEIEVVDL